jgi:hypothetical protein
MAGDVWSRDATTEITTSTTGSSTRISVLGLKNHR